MNSCVCVELITCESGCSRAAAAANGAVCKQVTPVVPQSADDAIVEAVHSFAVEHGSHGVVAVVRCEDTLKTLVYAQQAAAKCDHAGSRVSPPSPANLASQVSSDADLALALTLATDSGCATISFTERLPRRRAQSARVWRSAKQFHKRGLREPDCVVFYQRKAVRPSVRSVGGAAQRATCDDCAKLANARCR